MILERLDMQRSSAYTPLFQVAFNYRIGDLLQRKLGNCTMELMRYEDTNKPYDLTFNITQTSEGGNFVEVCSNDYLYSAAATEIVMNTFIGLLEGASLDLKTKVQDCRLNTDEQVEQALSLGRGPRVQHEWPKTLAERFHQVSLAFPDTVAIKDDEGSMTYTQLARRISALAEALINSGVGLDSRLAVLCRPSIDTYVAMLAILHIGAVYVPLDMSLPAARHRAMVSVCKPDLVVFQSAITSAAGHDEKGSLTVAEGELRLIWRAVLGEAAGAAIIQRDTDFFVVGGSSLLLVRLQNALKERLGIQLPLHELYQASTLRKMAAITSNQRSQLAAEVIDWEAETLIPASVLDAAKAQALPVPQQNQRHVLLTGATGFLGSEILKALISDENVAQIHCIAVPTDAKDKLPSSTKTTAYFGSLLSPNLGLSRKEASFLQSSIDQIIHTGAQVHCLNNYSSVRHANYFSTQFLATMALPRRVPLHFISSPRVILQSGTYEAAPVSMAAHPPPVDGSQGFTASKWAGEYFLEDVAREAGLPVVIHRPCSIVGSQAPHDDAMNSVVKYSFLSRIVPAVPNANGFFDFKDAVEVATEIAHGPVAQDSISCRHHSSGVRVPFSQLAQRMETLHGGKFEVVSLSDWIQKAQKLGIEDLIVTYLEANVANAPNLTFPFLSMKI